VATVLISIVERQQATRNMARSTENHHVALTQIISNTLLPMYEDFLRSAEVLSHDELFTDPTLRQIDQNIRTQVSGSNVAKIKIFDLDGRTILSTEAAQTGADKSRSEGFLSAKTGQVISQVGLRDSFQALESTLVDSHLLSSYIPIRANNATQDIIGVFEVYSDVTPLLIRIETTHRNILLCIFLISAVLYSFLCIFVYRADQLLSTQYQQIQDSEGHYRRKTNKLGDELITLRQTQAQMVHSAKMSSLGQMVAGIAHEINNPVNFVHGNLTHTSNYMHDLVGLIRLYEAHCPSPSTEIQTRREEIDIDFIKEDLSKAFASMAAGTQRIQQIVLSLRNFSRLDESNCKLVDIHQGLESTLVILQHQLAFSPSRPAIQVVRDFDKLPLIECYAGQLNQVFMNILTNAIDALETKQNNTVIASASPQITIRTEVRSEHVAISIANNGASIPPNIQSRIFDPFFTTKAVGKGTGMGLAISYQIVTEKHHGKIDCSSDEGAGTEFSIEIPIQQST